MAQYLAPLFLIVAGTSAQTSEGSGSDTTNGVLNVTEPDFELLVKLHGIGMVGAWGFLVPLGMSIALMCKSVCPGKPFVYVHLSIMLSGLLLVCISLIFIFIHAEGKWLNSYEPLSDPHKIMGLIGFAILALNPFGAIFTPNIESKWRPLFNFAHGGAGFFVGLLPALTAMLIAVHMLPSVSFDEDRTSLIIKLMSALVGYILLILAMYNIYPVRYHKDIPQPYKVPGMIKILRELEKEGASPEEEEEEEEKEEVDEKIPLQSSPDAVYRVAVMAATFAPVIGLSVAVIVYLAILD